jgi:Zn-dependent protease
VQGSLRLGRIAGIEVSIHYTWLFAFVLVTWSLAQGFFPAMFPGFAPSTYWLLGALAALGLFGSVLFHELSHSLVARARGLSVQGITLFIFGGVSNLGGEARAPGDEFLVSVVGPLSSLLLAGIWWALQQALAPGDTPAGALLGYLAVVNAGLAVFNLVPGFPLDGGRVLRSVIWGATHDLRRATVVASAVGQGVGFLLIAWGVARVLGGDLLGGLWTAFIGWFLNNAAESTRQQQAVAENLRGLRVRQFMNPDPPLVEPALPVSEFVFEHALRRGQRAVLVADRDGRLLGLMSITDARDVPPELWATTPVGRVMTQAPLKTVGPDTDLSAALELLVGGSFHQLPVVIAGQVVGLLDRAHLLRSLQVRDELGLRAPGDGVGSRPSAASRART